MYTTSAAAQKLSSIVTSVTREYTSQAQNPSQPIERTQTHEETEELRRTYEKIIESPDWKQQFTDASNLIITDLKEGKEVHQVNNKMIFIAVHDRLYEFDTGDKKYIMVGRKPGCDVLFNEIPYNGTSRMHTIIFPLPELKMIIVVDMGSLSGITTHKRSSDEKQCVSSLPKSRNVLIFDWEEIVILRMGQVQVAINPKDCVVCMVNPRNMTFGCGHHCTCHDCSQKITTCPICRAVIDKSNRGFREATNVAF